ncbi:hypothetical protein ACWEKT_07745 [Nocardia takedensis]
MRRASGAAERVGATMAVTLRVPGYREFAFLATAVRVPTTEGESLLEPGGPDLRADLDVGVLTICSGSRGWPAAVHGGWVEATDDAVRVYADAIEFADRIDVSRARQAQADAAEKLRHDRDDTAAYDALRRANVRMAVAALAHPGPGAR